MSRYIDADELEETMLYGMCGTGYQTLALSLIKEVPTADVEPVRHGYWEDGDKPIIPYEGHYSGNCSVCGEWSEYLTDYCPNCGARMDGENDE